MLASDIFPPASTPASTSLCGWFAHVDSILDEHAKVIASPGDGFYSDALAPYSATNALYWLSELCLDPPRVETLVSSDIRGLRVHYGVHLARQSTTDTRLHRSVSLPRVFWDTHLDDAPCLISPDSTPCSKAQHDALTSISTWTLRKSAFDISPLSITDIWAETTCVQAEEGFTSAQSASRMEAKPEVVQEDEAGTEQGGSNGPEPAELDISSSTGLSARLTMANVAEAEQDLSDGEGDAERASAAMLVEQTRLQNLPLDDGFDFQFDAPDDLPDTDADLNIEPATFDGEPAASHPGEIRLTAEDRCETCLSKNIDICIIRPSGKDRSKAPACEACRVSRTVCHRSNPYRALLGAEEEQRMYETMAKTIGRSLDREAWVNATARRGAGRRADKLWQEMTVLAKSVSRDLRLHTMANPVAQTQVGKVLRRMEQGD